MHFVFDILAQLTNILPRITLYELLKSPKQIREALREALEDSEVFVAYISEIAKEKEKLCTLCHQTSMNISFITFTLEDIQVKNNKHHQHLY